jgi:hypothetical protein
MGHECRQMCGCNEAGFPTKHKERKWHFVGYQTGDHAKACIPKGKYTGTHEGRISIRFRSSFGLNGFDVHLKYLRRLQRADGYSYQKGEGVCSPVRSQGFPRLVLYG